MSNPPLGTAPASAHGIVNIVAGLFWIIGLPVASYLLFDFSLWVLFVTIPLWTLLSCRITDKYIPCITGPVIDRIYQQRVSEKAPYSLPFKKHAIYRVEQDIVGDFDNLSAGTTLRYTHSGQSIYDGYIGFFFVDTEGEIRRWDIHDDQDPVHEAADRFTEVSRSDHVPTKQAEQDSAHQSTTAP